MSSGTMEFNVCHAGEGRDDVTCGDSFTKQPLPLRMPNSRGGAIMVHADFEQLVGTITFTSCTSKSKGPEAAAVQL